jgi:hypothetical protein
LFVSRPTQAEYVAPCSTFNTRRIFSLGRVKVVLTLFILVLLGGILGLIAWQVEDSKSSNGKTHVPDHYIIGNLYLEKSKMKFELYVYYNEKKA